jgi:hypothetical protein
MNGPTLTIFGITGNAYIIFGGLFFLLVILLFAVFSIKKRAKETLVTDKLILAELGKMSAGISDIAENAPLRNMNSEIVDITDTTENTSLGKMNTGITNITDDSYPTTQQCSNCSKINPIENVGCAFCGHRMVTNFR